MQYVTLAVSDDGSMWGAGCFDNMDVYPLVIGKFKDGAESGKIVKIDRTMKLLDILWRPNSHQLIAITYS